MNNHLSMKKYVSKVLLVLTLTLAMACTNILSMPYGTVVEAASKPGKCESLCCDKKTTTSIKVSWDKVSKKCKYQVAYKKKGTDTYKKKTTSNTYLNIKNLKSNTSYNVKVRAYKTVDGNKVYGKWSAVKTFKTKKKSSATTSNHHGEGCVGDHGTGVYITDTGTKYHYDPGCRGLKNANDIHTCTLDYAKSNGYTLCGWED